jgi:hypothetical protein
LLYYIWNRVQLRSLRHVVGYRVQHTQPITSTTHLGSISMARHITTRWSVLRLLFAIFMFSTFVTWNMLGLWLCCMPHPLMAKRVEVIGPLPQWDARLCSQKEKKKASFPFLLLCYTLAFPFACTSYSFNTSE